MSVNSRFIHSNISVCSAFYRGCQVIHDSLPCNKSQITRLLYCKDAGTYHLERDAQNGYTTQLTDGTLTQDRAYNDYGELNKVSDNTFTYEITERYPDGSIKQKEETLNGTTETWNYEYDNMGRLTKACRVGLPSHQGCEEYTYDANGNRATATLNGTSITNTEYTLDDSLIVYGDNSYSYDEDGYLQNKTTPNGTTAYTYGSLGELVAVNTPEHNISYFHNALNQRVAKKIDGVIVEKYLWKNLTRLLAIYDKDDNLVQRFEYADQRMPVAMKQGSTKYYLHYDQVGSLRAVTDDSHNIVKEIVYDTFGNVLTDSNPTLKVPFGFAGGLYDSDTKLTRFGYRDYDAYTGKWTAKDPIGFSGGDSNLYGYVLGNPVNLIDPTGKFGIPGAIAGALTGAGMSFWNPCTGKFDRIPGGLEFIRNLALGGLGGFFAGLGAASGSAMGAGIGLGGDMLINLGNYSGASSPSCNQNPPCE